MDDVAFCLAATDAIDLASGWTREAIAAVLTPLSVFARDVVAPTTAESDRIGCVLRDGRVLMPEPLPAVYRQYLDLGWHLLPIGETDGGIGAPDALCLAATEVLSRANPAFQMVIGLVGGAVDVLTRMGDASHRGFIAQLAGGSCLATMCLTEPGAGSDLAAIRTMALQGADCGWTLRGEKIFISGGDQNLSDGIVHLVLARTGPVEAGTRGLSLFACPSKRANRGRNAITVLRIEEKAGLHASPTCHLSFEDAEAVLVGAPGEGLRAMFIMMNHARLDVAMQGVAAAQAASTIAGDFAEARVQGRDRAGRPVAISSHGDVLRTLLRIDALTLGCRAMVLRTARHLQGNKVLAEFLTPVVKVFATEAGSEAADIGMQVLGGSGYLTEYGIERVWRDVRVSRIYEGTNGVLAMTLVNRLIRSPAGVAAFRAEIAALIGTEEADVSNALADWALLADEIGSADDAGFAAASFMRLTGLIYFAAVWRRLDLRRNEANAPERIATIARFVAGIMLTEVPGLIAASRAALRFSADA